MNHINKLYQVNCLSKAKSAAKKKYKYNKKKLLIVKYLVADLNLFLSDFVPKNVSERISLESEQIFNYFLNKNIVDVFLFLVEKKNEWVGVYKVCPHYLSKKENFLKIEKHLNNGEMIFDLKFFYLETIKKYNI